MNGCMNRCMDSGYFPFMCKKCIVVANNKCDMETHTVIKSDIIN